MSAILKIDLIVASILSKRLDGLKEFNATDQIGIITNVPISSKQVMYQAEELRNIIWGSATIDFNESDVDEYFETNRMFFTKKHPDSKMYFVVFPDDTDCDQPIESFKIIINAIANRTNYPYEIFRVAEICK